MQIKHFTPVTLLGIFFKKNENLYNRDAVFYSTHSPSLSHPGAYLTHNATWLSDCWVKYSAEFVQVAHTVASIY